jgi:ABC-type branched-subunit amino acid transport system substrate-binding protein
VTVNSNKPGGAVSRVGRRFQARARLLAIGGIAAVLLAAGCSSSSSSTGAAASSSAASSATGGASSAAPSGPAAAGNDIGITATTIKVGLIADVNTSVQPGLFQKSVNAVKAWADIVNASGGVAGRKVTVDFCDSKLDPNATSNCVIQACQNDFALVGTSANALEDLADIDGCKNSAGKAVGIPNLAAFAFLPLGCDPDTFLTSGIGTYCKSAKQNPQSYTVNVGDMRYYTSHNPGLHGTFVYDNDVPTLKFNFFPLFTGGNNLGIKKDGEGFYGEGGAAPQSALTPVVSTMKSANSSFVYAGGTPNNTILLEREAKLQGVNSVKVWACNSGCYDQSFIQQGGASINGTYAVLPDLPFYSDAQSNPALAALIKQVGGVSNINNNAITAYIGALLFQDAVQKAVANGGTLDRETLFTAIKNEHSFNAQGIIGATDVGMQQPSPCFALAQVQNGQWNRVYPAKAGTFDCSAANLTTIKMNVQAG